MEKEIQILVVEDDNDIILRPNLGQGGVETTE